MNAGHNYPFLLKADGRIVRLDKGGIMLGVVPNAKYQIGTEPIGSGDLLYMFTDGVSEAMDPEEQQFTEERIEHVLTVNSALGAEELLETIRLEVSAFVGSAPQSDDITHLCVRFS